MPRLLLWILLLSAYSVRSQSISGSVQNEKGRPVAAATILVLHAKDSIPYKIDISNNEGKFSISNLKNGIYLVCATHVGYVKTYSSTMTIPSAGTNDLKLILLEHSSSLQTLTIVSRKPMIEVTAGRTVINVEGTLNNIGTTALDVLRKSPGVNIDNEDNISVGGKNGVQVYIDGRQSPLTGTDLSGYLSSLQSGQIESIEIITNPSAKYESAGNAGIINIRLKKNKAFGTNGSVNAGYGIGNFPKYNAGFSINHRNRLVNIFATYTYGNSQNLIRTYNNRNSADSVFNQTAKRVFTDKPHNIQAGIDFFLNKVSTIGILLNAAPGTTISDNTSITTIQHEDSANTQMLLDASSILNIERKNTNVNLNYRYVTGKKEFNFDIDYVNYRMLNDQFQPNYYYDSDTNFMFSRIYHMFTTSEIQMHSAKLNYDFDAWKGKLSIGGKYGKVDSENELARHDVVGSIEKFDSSTSNDFDYHENINAVFARYTREYQKIQLQFGIRIENTVVSGVSTGYRWSGAYMPYDSSFKKTYTDAFPSASISFRRNTNNRLSISFGRRIDRPRYSDLNPFEYRIDEYVYRTGNTNLRPQYTTIIELVNVYKDKFTTSVSYSHVKDLFTSIFDTTQVSRTFLTATNLSSQDVFNLSINYIFQGKRVTGFINLNPAYNNYKSNFGKGRDLHLKAFSYSVKSQVGYRFKHGFASELAVVYNSPAIGLGSFEFRANASVDLALAKSMFDNRFSIKASITDIFFTNQIRGTSDFVGQQIDVKRTFEPRVFRVNFSYRFGSSTVKAARQRRTLMEEENRRMQSAN